MAETSLTQRESLMFFSGWLKVYSDPPPPFSLMNSMEILSTNGQSPKKKALLFCQVLNQFFTIATNESLTKTLLYVPLSDITLITEPTTQHPTKFSITIDVKEDSRTINDISPDNENNENAGNDNSNLLLDEYDTKQDLVNSFNHNFRINTFLNQNFSDTKMTFYFKSHSAPRAKKWIVALMQHHVNIANGIGTESVPIVEKMMSIDDFTIKKKIGCGYSGEVLLAQNKQTGQYYALKSIPKNNVMKSNRIMRAMAERNILMSASHPFITKLVSTFQTTSHLFLVLEFVPGGNLAYHLNRDVMFDEEIIRLYLAEIATALSYLHNMGIVFRDLKPENILIGEDGHLKLTDFGHAKYLINQSYYESLSKMAKQNLGNTQYCMCFDSMRRSGSFCGTNEFLAPEMIEQKGYNFAVDWWAYGVLAYRLICGTLPFRNLNLERLFKMITDNSPKFYDPVPPDERDFIERLLEKDPHKRLGCNSDVGEKEIFEHPYFKSINWDMVYKKEYTPSFIPESTEFNLVANFDPRITRQKPCGFIEMNIDSSQNYMNENENDADSNITHVTDFSFTTIRTSTPQIPNDV